MVEFYQRFKIYIWLVAAAAVLFILFNLWLNLSLKDEMRVRRFILQGKKAAEARNILTCANMISINYADKYGNDRSSLIYVTRQAFGYYRKIFIRIDSIKIEVDKSKARAYAEITAQVIGQAQDDSKEMILEGEKGRLNLRLIKEGEAWRLIEVESFQPIRIMGQYVS